VYTIPNTCFRDPFTFTGSEKLNKRVSCNKRFAPLALEHENYFLGSTLPQQHKNTSQKTGRRFQTLAPPQWLPALPKLPVRLFLSPAGRAFIISLSLWLLAFLYCRQHFWHDPHSAFFWSEHVYDLKYSAFRQLQAESFIASTKFTNRTATVSRHPEICAAFVTVKRETKQYIDAAVGSLLEGLTVEERGKLWLYVLFADTDPSVHQSWKGWLGKAADEVGSYAVNNQTLHHLRTLEKERNWYEKGVLSVFSSMACKRLS
jgi:hypothetical protein